MPCDYKNYHPDWKGIVKLEKIRTHNRCEMCGVKNGFIKDDGVKIVLTVHHIDGDKTNNKYPNLLVCCQRCHLRLDLGKHMKNAKETRMKKAGVKKCR